MPRHHHRRLTLVLTVLTILCLVAACSDDPSDGGNGSGSRTAAHLHGTWATDMDRMRDAAATSRKFTEKNLKELESLTLTLSEGSRMSSAGEQGEWKIASTDGDTWEFEAKRDGTDRWRQYRIEWIDDDHITFQQQANEVIYMKRQK